MIDTIVQWLHGIGLHTDPAVAASAEAMGQEAGQALGHMDMPALLALAGALGWASGFRLYAVVFLVGVMGAADLVPLPSGLHLLEHPVVLAVSGFMLLVESRVVLPAFALCLLPRFCRQRLLGET